MKLRRVSCLLSAAVLTGCIFFAVLGCATSGTGDSGKNTGHRAN